MEQIMCEKYISILKEELIPAMGCTEPDCAGLCGGKGRGASGLSAG